MTSVPIIVVTYNRPRSLKRLLASLAAAIFSSPVKLIISIDGGGEAACKSISDEFIWPHGEKEVINHPQNLGLKEHIHFCAGLSSRYEGVIILEDDLFVSPYFYDFTVRAAEYFRDDTLIAGISLYSHCYNETAQFPFIPCLDGSDVFFMQYPSSWGQYWSKQRWEEYTNWRSNNVDKPVHLPRNIQLWPQSSWKKSFTSYLADTGKLFVYPRLSLTTNFNEAGQHQVHREYFLQRPLLLSGREYVFISPAESLSVYDSYNELLPACLKWLNPALAAYDFETDLYGMKDPGYLASEFTLTSSRGMDPVMSFGRAMKPLEANIICNIPGDHFNMIPTKNLLRRDHFRKLKKCSDKEEVRYHYGLRFYHRRRAWLILAAGNVLYHPVIFPMLKKLSGLFPRSPHRPG